MPDITEERIESVYLWMKDSYRQNPEKFRITTHHNPMNHSFSFSAEGVDGTDKDNTTMNKPQPDTFIDPIEMLIRECLPDGLISKLADESISGSPVMAMRINQLAKEAKAAREKQVTMLNDCYHRAKRMPQPNWPLWLGLKARISQLISTIHQ